MNILSQIVKRAPAGVQKAVSYVIGKPVEELRREKGFAADFKIVKLASNENPLGPSPKAIAAAEKELKALNIYPDGGGYALRSKISAKLGVEMSQILLGNGSENVLDMVCRALLNPGDDVLLCEGCFPQFTLVATLAGAEVRYVPCNEDFSPNLERFLEQIRPNTRMLIIGHPDNPSGAFLKGEELKRLQSALPADAVLVIDEAYFGLVTAAGFQDSFELGLNDGKKPVITSRTLSKSAGLAGLRFGFAIMPSELCDLVSKVRLPFNVNSCSQAAAIAALDDEDHIKRSRDLIAAEKPKLCAACRELGLKVIEGASNFVLVHTGNFSSQELSDKLQDLGVIVRPMKHPKMPNFVRVSIGLPAENQAFVTALQEVMAS